MLQFLYKKYNIEDSDVLNEMNKMKKNEILEQHPFAIWFSDSDIRWHSYLPDETKPNHRKPIAKRCRENLDNFIVNYYLEHNNSFMTLSSDFTLRDIYPRWLDSRSNSVSSIGTIKRNDQDWKRYYLNDPIIDIPFRFLTKAKLCDWVHNTIRKNMLSKKEYYNMSIIMRGCWQYAVDDQLIELNEFAKVKVNTKKFRQTKKKNNAEAVYLIPEQKAIIDYSYSLFKKNDKNITALTFPLLFQTGMRIGEVVALKYSDIEGSYIHVQRMDSIDYLYNDGTFKYNSHKVVEHVKSDDGDRLIPLTPEAIKIIDMVRKASQKYDFYCDDYIFCPSNHSIMAGTLDKKLYRYCIAAGISKKSAHKMRKFYISKLVVSGKVDIDTVRKIAGHADTQTTFNNYCFNINTDEVTYQNVVDAIQAS